MGWCCELLIEFYVGVYLYVVLCFSFIMYARSQVDVVWPVEGVSEYICLWEMHDFNKELIMFTIFLFLLMWGSWWFRYGIPPGLVLCL